MSQSVRCEIKLLHVKRSFLECIIVIAHYFGGAPPTVTTDSINYKQN